MLAPFEESHPGITVQQQSAGTGQAEYRERILTSIVAGHPPDVLLLDNIDVPAFTNRRVLLDLAPYLPRLGIDLARYDSTVLGIFRRGAAIYALPKGYTPMVLVYNKDLFDRAGIPYPSDDWTWDDFLRVAQSLTRDTDGDGQIDQWGTAYDRRYFLWAAWLWSGGGDILCPGGDRATGCLDAPASVAAIRWYTDWVTRDSIVPRAYNLRRTLGDNLRLFYSGKVAMLTTGHFWIPNLRPYTSDGRLRVGFVEIPHLTRSAVPDGDVRVGARRAGERAAPPAVGRAGGVSRGLGGAIDPRRGRPRAAESHRRRAGAGDSRHDRLGSGVPARQPARAHSMGSAHRALAGGGGSAPRHDGPDHPRARRSRRGRARDGAPARPVAEWGPPVKLAWRLGAVGVATAAGLGALVVGHGVARRAEHEAAARAARTAAAFLAIVTPSTSGGAGYDLVQLLAQSRGLGRLPGWAGRIEVYHGTAPLVRATAAPLSADVFAELRDREATRFLEGAMLAPLKDREDWDVVGAVAVTPVATEPVLAGWNLVFLVAFAITGGLAVTGKRWRRRRAVIACWGVAVIVGVAGYLQAVQGERDATDRWLNETSLVLERAAARVPQRGGSLVIRLAPIGREADLTPSDSGPAAVQRVTEAGVRFAEVRVRLTRAQWVRLRAAGR